MMNFKFKTKSTMKKHSWSMMWVTILVWGISQES